MTKTLLLPQKYRSLLESIFQRHLPGVEVWAYGSRLTEFCHDGSDLDLALRAPDLRRIPIEKLANVRYALRESTIPFLVDVHDWARLPVEYHEEIEKNYVCLV